MRLIETNPNFIDIYIAFANTSIYICINFDVGICEPPCLIYSIDVCY